MKNNKKAFFYTDNHFGSQPSVFELQIGYEVIPLVNSKNTASLLDEINLLKNMIDYEYGIPLSPILIRDNMTLDSNDYAICLSGNIVAKGNLRMGYNLFVDTGKVTPSEKEVNKEVHAEKITEPITGKTAYWINVVYVEESERLEKAGFVKVLPEEEIRIHLYKIITENLTKILNQSMVNTLINKLRPTNPDVIDDIFFNHQFPISSMKKILNLLLAENYSIRDMNTILETIADNISQNVEPDFFVQKIKEQLLAPVAKKDFYEL